MKQISEQGQKQLRQDVSLFIAQARVVYGMNPYDMASFVLEEALQQDIQESGEWAKD